MPADYSKSILRNEPTIRANEGAEKNVSPIKRGLYLDRAVILELLKSLRGVDSSLSISKSVDPTQKCGTRCLLGRYRDVTGSDAIGETRSCGEVHLRAEASGRANRVSEDEGPVKSQSFENLFKHLAWRMGDMKV